MAELREALAAAFDTDSSADTGIPASPEPTTPEPSSEPADTGSPIDTAKVTPEPDGGSVRDSLGRFVKTAQADGKGQMPAAPLDATGAPVAQPVAHPDGQPATQTYERPPRSVPIELRAAWSGLKPEWRQHVTEAHARLAQVEDYYRPSMEFAQRFLQTVQPYQQAIQAETGGDAIAAVRGLMDTAARLRFGTPNEKAHTIAMIVKSYGVDIEALDGALAGVVPPPGSVDPAAMVQQQVQAQLAPLFQQAQQRRAMHDEQTQTAIRSELQTFAADPKNEFFEDVREVMADAIEVAARQGVDLPLNEAYRRACLMHPEVSKVFFGRQQGQSAQSLTQAAQRAKAAAVSVKGSAPVGSPDPNAPVSVRGAIEAAIEAHSRV